MTHHHTTAPGPHGDPHTTGGLRPGGFDASDPLTHSGSARLAAITQLQAILDWPGLYLVAAEVDRALAEEARARAAKAGTKPGRGRRSSFPTAVMLFLIIGFRVTTSLPSLLTLVRDREVWQHRLAPVFAARPETEGLLFPGAPPNRDQVRHFLDKLVSTDGLDARLQQTFQRVAIAQTLELGNFDPGVEPDWADPSLRHSIIGDGVVMKPPSEVRRYVDGVTGEVIHTGSRATGSTGKTAPRLAPMLTDLAEDGKSDLRGLNMVSLLTSTVHGWVILGTGIAAGAEQWAALDLLDSVAAKAGRGVHSLLWDRVFNGWLTDYTMARHGIRVMNKSVGANGKDQDPEDDVDNDGLQRRLANQRFTAQHDETRARRLLAEHGLDADNTEGDEERREAVRVNAVITNGWRQQELYEMWLNGQPQPLGISLYRATSASTVTGSRNASNRIQMEIVRSRFRRFGTETHEGTGGPCVHDLYVDDGALHTVENHPEEGYLVKTATARCVSATPRRRAGGRFGSTDVWLMPCPRGDFEITTEWNPEANRYTAETPKEERHAPKDMVLNELRPVSRSQAQQFADIVNFRNNAESYNNWVKKSYPRHGRASSFTVAGQALDYLAAACLCNALTWARYEHDEQHA